MDERRQAAEIANVKAPLYSAGREPAGEIELAGAVFGRTGHKGLLFDAVRMQLANRRAGTAATKTRGLISGGGRKPWRQKGTGRARAGSTRSPLWRHGGTIFGPQPRDYSYQMPKKAWRRALTLALSDRALNGKLTVVDSLEIKEGRTKLYREALNKLDAKRTALIVENGKTLTESLVRGARNLKGVELVLNNEVHPYDLLRYDRAIFSKAAIEQLAEVLVKTASKRKAAQKEAA